MLADLVAVADSQVAALAGEDFIERICTEDSPCRYLVSVAHRGPAFDEDVWLEAAVCTDDNVLLDDTEICDYAAGPITASGCTRAVGAMEHDGSAGIPLYDTGQNFR